MNAEIKDVWAMSHDGDDWGQCMGIWFAIANCLHRHNGPIPRHWQFRAGATEEAAEDWPDTMLEDLLHCEAITFFDLVQAGNVFARYASILQAQGKAY